MNLEKIGSQQKCLVASKSCSYQPNLKKKNNNKIKFRHFDILKEMYTTIVKDIETIKYTLKKNKKKLYTLIVFRKMEVNSSVSL